MKHAYLLLVLILVMWSGCNDKDEQVSTLPSLNLLFSTDTISFDTLLSNQRSSTRRLTIYNPNEEAIQLGEVSLADASNYSAVINGKETTNLQNEIILGGDSLLMLVEAFILPRNQDEPYLVKDSVLVNWNGNRTNIKLRTWGQDVQTRRNEIICDEIWTSARPYAVADTLIVNEGCTLTLEKGTKVYFENDAVMFVLGRVVAEGDTSELVEFTSARFDGIYAEVPGQWQGIYFLEGSSGDLNHTKISNAIVGTNVGFPGAEEDTRLTLNSIEIANMSYAGILAFTANIQATNSLIYNCGTYLVGNFAGGSYDYQHCTFSNEVSDFVHADPSIQFADNIVDNGVTVARDLDIRILNSILWSTEDELLVNNGGGATITALVNGNIIRGTEELEGNIFSTEFNFPGFTNPFANDFTLDTLANAQDEGIQPGLMFDIVKNRRDSLPDIGAYERIE